MQLLPDLPEYLANELAIGLGRVAEPCQLYLISMLKVLSHSELADLQGGLALWLAGMRPDVMVERYRLVRQLIMAIEQIDCEERRQ
jgi:hypothetical protein